MYISILHWLITMNLPIIIPFIIITPFLIVYYINHRKTLKAKLKDCPHQTSLNNIENEKNYRLKLLVCHFIILILIIEWSSNIIYGLAYFPNFKKFIVYHFPPSQGNYTNVQLTATCWIEQNNKLKQFSSLADWLATIVPFGLHESLSLLIMPISTILLRILSKAFFNYPYKGTAYKSLAFISLRSLLVTFLLLVRITHYPASVIQIACVTADYICFLRASRRFYAVLKSRKIEARWHSTRKDYIEKYHVFYQYKITSTYTTITFLVYTLRTLVDSGLTVLYFFINTNVCVISYMTLGIVNINVNNSTVSYLQNMYTKMDYLRFTLGYAYQFLISFAYLMVILAIIVAVLKKRRFYQRVNHIITRPLVAQYHDTIYEPYNLYNNRI